LKSSRVSRTASADAKLKSLLSSGDLKTNARPFSEWKKPRQDSPKKGAPSTSYDARGIRFISYKERHQRAAFFGERK